MSRKSRDKLLDKLESLKTEYDHLYDTVRNTYEQLNSAHDRAYMIVDKSASLVASIKHAPVTVGTKAKRIMTEKLKVSGKNELKKQERNRDIADGAAAVAALGIGGILASAFSDFLGSIAKKIGKYGSWIIAAIFIVFVFFGFLLWKVYNREKTIKQATNAINTVSKENAKLKSRQAKAEQSIKKINMQMPVIVSLLDELQKYEGYSFLTIPKDDRVLLSQLVNDTLALTGILGEEL